MNHHVSPSPRPAEGQGGFTISEVLLVVGVIALLVTIAVVSLDGIRSGSSERNCRTELRALKAATEEFHSLFGTYPADDRALQEAEILDLSKTPHYQVVTGTDGNPSYEPVGDACS